MCSILVTVGTTKFDKLIRNIDTDEFMDAARSKGYNKLIIQKGAGSYLPRNLVPQGTSVTRSDGLTVEFFEFTPSLAELMRAAALIISHAGSGSIYEALHLSKPLIVVPNNDLMDNHQVELGEKLQAMRHLVCAMPEDVAAAVRALDATSLVPFQRGSAAGIVRRIDTLMGQTAAT